MKEKSSFSVARWIVDNFFPEEAVIFRVKHPTNAQRVLGKTKVEIPIGQIKDENLVLNAIKSLETPSVFS
jgi:hypothetical protein